MKFHEAIAAGIRHIQENKRRAGLSILDIFIGIASVLCMMAIGDGAKQIIADDIEKSGGQIKSNSGHKHLAGDVADDIQQRSDILWTTLVQLRGGNLRYFIQTHAYWCRIMHPFHRFVVSL